MTRLHEAVIDITERRLPPRWGWRLQLGEHVATGRAFTNRRAVWATHRAAKRLQGRLLDESIARLIRPIPDEDGAA